MHYRRLVPSRLRVVSTFAAVIVFIAGSSTGCGTGVKDTTPTRCPADDYEPNDTQETAFELHPMKDDPNSTQDVLDVSVHNASDVDWFRIAIDDTGIGGDPVITASVSSQAFTVTTWFVCASGHPGTTECQFGSEANERVNDDVYVYGCRGEDLDPVDDGSGSIVLDNGNGVVSTTDCSATSDDDGVLYVRVERTSSLSSECSYRLNVSVE